jgi:hypothetical protein
MNLRSWVRGGSPDLYSDEYEHGDVEDFDTEAYL